MCMSGGGGRFVVSCVVVGKERRWLESVGEVLCVSSSWRHGWCGASACALSFCRRGFLSS